MMGQTGSMSFGTPSHGQNTSSYLPGYLLGGHTPSQMVGIIDQRSSGLNEKIVWLIICLRSIVRDKLLEE